MASYYYLMASLPMLKADGEMPFGYGEFLNMCRETVAKPRFEILEGLTLDSKEGVLISEWAEFYGSYKAELTYQRNQRLGKPSQLPLFRDATVMKAVTAAMNDTNPLNAEKSLLALQFEKLDSIIGTHTFDIEALYGYALKLKLLERKTVFNAKSGKAEFSRIDEGLQKQILNIE